MIVRNNCRRWLAAGAISVVAIAVGLGGCFTSKTEVPSGMSCENGEDCFGNQVCLEGACRNKSDLDVGHFGDAACSPQPKENNCGDGIDNDCDGKTDCEDSDCLDMTCGSGESKACRFNATDEEPASGACCTKNGGSSVQCVELLCWDRRNSDGGKNGVDNDRDNDPNCADADCDEKNCGQLRPGHDGAKCNHETGMCEEFLCAGGNHDEQGDNDGDGEPDCDDTDCKTRPGYTKPDTETNCSDGLDNDCDGMTDSQDPDCSS